MINGITFRITPKNPLVLLSHPFLCCFFLYLLSTSVDIYYVKVFFAKCKIPHAAGLCFFCLFAAGFRVFHAPRLFTQLACALLGSCMLSAIHSINPIACIAFILFLIFNYFVFFLIPHNLFYHIPASTIFRVYSLNFFFLGAYALCQVLFSFGGILLPGVSQFILGIARGSGFLYEPSFYALYMTPFAIFYTAQYLLQPPAERKLSCLIWPNLFLLASTSTGCIFTYFTFYLFLILFSACRLIKLRLSRLLWQYPLMLALAFLLIWTIHKQFLIGGLLKFFFQEGGVLAHGSVQTRGNGVLTCLQIFYDHKLLGVGLGSVPFYIAAQYSGDSIGLFDPNILEDYSATNVAAELLASLGLLGACLFAGFCFLLIRTFRTARRIPSLSSEEERNLTAFMLSVCVLFVTLQFNQSIMRPYLWIHLGLFVGYAESLKRSREWQR